MNADDGEDFGLQPGVGNNYILTNLHLPVGKADDGGVMTRALIGSFFQTFDNYLMACLRKEENT